MCHLNIYQWSCSHACACVWARTHVLVQRWDPVCLLLLQIAPVRNPKITTKGFSVGVMKAPSAAIWAVKTASRSASPLNDTSHVTRRQERETASHFGGEQHGCARVIDMIPRVWTKVRLSSFFSRLLWSFDNFLSTLHRPSWEVVEKYQDQLYKTTYCTWSWCLIIVDVSS